MTRKRYTTIKYTVYRLILPIVGFAFFSCKKTPSTIIPTTPEPPVKYTLVWSDEFNEVKVDSTSWNIDSGNPGINHEKQYYQSANAVVTDGNLVITAKKESVAGFQYTSAQINSMGKVNGTYGKVEARIKMPLGQGLWPAFWCLGSDLNSVGWPACGEIDIAQHVNSDSFVQGGVRWVIDKPMVNGFTTATTADEYHLYAIEWDTNSIKWFIDSKLYFTQNIANGLNSTGVFHLPFFIILGMAVGGDLPGTAIDESKLPAAMYVDYVRIYEPE